MLNGAFWSNTETVRVCISFRRPSWDLLWERWPTCYNLRAATATEPAAVDGSCQKQHSSVCAKREVPMDFELYLRAEERSWVLRSIRPQNRTKSLADSTWWKIIRFIQKSFRTLYIKAQQHGILCALNEGNMCPAGVHLGMCFEILCAFCACWCWLKFSTSYILTWMVRSLPEEDRYCTERERMPVLVFIKHMLEYALVIIFKESEALKPILFGLIEKDGAEKQTVHRLCSIFIAQNCRARTTIEMNKSSF